MKKFSVIAFTVVMAGVWFAGDVSASTIGKGTVSISTSSDVFYLIRKTKDEDNYTEFNADFAGGYFLLDNLEIEIGVNLEKTDNKEYEDKTSWYGIDSMVRYHFPLKENFNLYVGGGIGFGKYHEEGKDWAQYSDTGNWYQDSYDRDQNRFALRSEIGGEWFLNPMIALTIGAKYQRYKWSSDDYSWDDVTRNYFYVPNIGIKIFTTRSAAE